MMKESDKYEQENALDLKEKEIFDLNENLEYEKEKRKNMERMFQDLTERENELQKQLKVSKEKIKVSCTNFIWVCSAKTTLMKQRRILRGDNITLKMLPIWFLVEAF